MKSGPSLGTGDILIATDLDNVCPLLEENLSSTAKRFWKINHTSPQVLVRPLEWGSYNHAFKILNELGSRNLTHIICSDLVSFLGNSRGEEHMDGFNFINFIAKVYFPHLLAPLLRTLIHLTSAPPSSSRPSIIISYRIRSLPKEIPFWSAFGLWFSYEPVLYRGDYQSPLPPHRENTNYEKDRPPLNAHSNGDPETGWSRFHAPSSTYIFIARRKNGSLGWTVPEDDKDLLEGVGAHDNQRREGDDTFELILLMDLADDEG